jgi:hypothetical protein
LQRSAGHDQARLSWVSLAAALTVFAAYQAFAALLAGHFEYPLDDVYIHLAMAEGIAAGGYGVNPGEPASAASSVLYPVLLTPFAGTGLQRALPLMWNILGLSAAAWLWGRALELGGARGTTGLVLAVVAPVALNMPGVAFLGMEHMLHTAAALAILLGMWRLLNGDGLAPWFLAAVVIAPLLRIEGLALSLAVCGLLVVSGRPRAGVALALAVFAPIAAFSAYLVSLGLGPVPSSMLVKIELVSHDATGLAKVLKTAVFNLHKPMGAMLGLLSLASAVLAMGFADIRNSPSGKVLAVLSLAGFAHLAFGQIGWMHRYEHYIIVSLLAGLVMAGPGPDGRHSGVVHGLAALAVAISGVVYLPAVTGRLLWNTRALSLQQVQMARFARDFAKVPVAVNDLGRVAWNNDGYVLDLWGLASDEARRVRTAVPPPAPGWAEPLTTEHKVPLAMIYDSWLGWSVGPDWVPLARMTMDRPYGWMGDWVVTYYATSPEAAPKLRAALDAFAANVPADVRMEMLGGGA